MRRRSSLCALLACLLLLAGCGAIQPRVGARISGTGDGAMGGIGSGAPSVPTADGARDHRPTSDRVCRTGTLPSGWIAVGYAAGERCPTTSEAEAAYSVAIIERYSDRPVGATMEVCADQLAPRNWNREWRVEATLGCPGARVPVDAPTSYVMRRTR